jgi:dTDP-L-rhamnose 4-epimerase
VSDIVQANLLAMESETANFQAINVGTGQATSVKQMAQMLAKGLGLELEPEIVGSFRAGDIRHCVADITRAQVLLGYQPTVLLEEGIHQLLDWVCEQQSTDRVMRATAELHLHGLIR